MYTLVYTHIFLIFHKFHTCKFSQSIKFIYKLPNQNIFDTYWFSSKSCFIRSHTFLRQTVTSLKSFPLNDHFHTHTYLKTHFDITILDRTNLIYFQLMIGMLLWINFAFQIIELPMKKAKFLCLSCK